MNDSEILQQQHEALGNKLSKFERRNSDDHSVIHARMDGIFKWLLGLLITIIVTTVITLWQMGMEAADRRAADVAVHTETDTTQTAVLSRLDNVEDEVKDVNEHSEQRMTNHTSSLHKDR
jgi:cell division septal protein FtsQ